MSPTPLSTGEIAFGPEDPHHRENGGVGRPVLAGERFGDLGHGGGSFVPEDLHDAEFGVGESAGFGAGHGRIEWIGFELLKN
jgi:hypothetical protein